MLQLVLESQEIDVLLRGRLPNLSEWKEFGKSFIELSLGLTNGGQSITKQKIR